MPSARKERPAERAKLSKAQSQIAAAILRPLIDCTAGERQLSLTQKQDFVEQINAAFVGKGELPIYNVRKLEDWVGNRLYRWRVSQRAPQDRPQSWQRRKTQSLPQGDNSGAARCAAAATLSDMEGLTEQLSATPKPALPVQERIIIGADTSRTHPKDFIPGQTPGPPTAAELVLVRDNAAVGYTMELHDDENMWAEDLMWYEDPGLSDSTSSTESWPDDSPSSHSSSYSSSHASSHAGSHASSKSWSDSDSFIIEATEEEVSASEDAPTVTRGWMGHIGCDDQASVPTKPQLLAPGRVEIVHAQRVQHAAARLSSTEFSKTRPATHSKGLLGLSFLTAQSRTFAEPSLKMDATEVTMEATEVPVVVKCPHCEHREQNGQYSKLARHVRKKGRSANKRSQWWKQYGYSGPAYCQRCAEVFRDHLIRKKSNRFSCSRDKPCSHCDYLLGHFDADKYFVYSRIDQKQLGKKEKQLGKKPSPLSSLAGCQKRIGSPKSEIQRDSRVTKVRRVAAGATVATAMVLTVLAMSLSTSGGAGEQLAATGSRLPHFSGATSWSGLNQNDRYLFGGIASKSCTSSSVHEPVWSSRLWRSTAPWSPSSPSDPSASADWTEFKGSSARRSLGTSWNGHSSVEQAGWRWPAARALAMSWSDPTGNAFVFGGRVPGAGGVNDLWVFDPDDGWTFLGGTTVPLSVVLSGLLPVMDETQRSKLLSSTAKAQQDAVSRGSPVPVSALFHTYGYMIASSWDRGSVYSRCTQADWRPRAALSDLNLGGFHALRKAFVDPFPGECRDKGRPSATGWPMHRSYGAVAAGSLISEGGGWRVFLFGGMIRHVNHYPDSDTLPWVHEATRSGRIDHVVCNASEPALTCADVLLNDLWEFKYEKTTNEPTWILHGHEGQTYINDPGVISHLTTWSGPNPLTLNAPVPRSVDDQAVDEDPPSIIRPRSFDEDPPSIIRPSSRAGHAAFLDGVDGRLFVFGGLALRGGQTQVQTTNELWTVHYLPPSADTAVPITRSMSWDFVSGAHRTIPDEWIVPWQPEVFLQCVSQVARIMANSAVSFLDVALCQIDSFSPGESAASFLPVLASEAVSCRDLWSLSALPAGVSAAPPAPAVLQREPGPLISPPRSVSAFDISHDRVGGNQMEPLYASTIVLGPAYGSKFLAGKDAFTLVGGATSSSAVDIDDAAGTTSAGRTTSLFVADEDGVDLLMWLDHESGRAVACGGETLGRQGQLEASTRCRLMQAPSDHASDTPELVSTLLAPNKHKLMPRLSSSREAVNATKK